MASISELISLSQPYFHLNKKLLMSAKNFVKLMRKIQNSFLRKIQNPIKFEPCLRCCQIEKSKHTDFIYNYEKLFSSKRESHRIWSKTFWSKTFFEKFKIIENLNVSKIFFPIQFQTSLNCDLFMTNYLARLLAICGG